MASAFDVPALMISEQDTIAFSSQAEIAKMFERAVQRARKASFRPGRKSNGSRL